MKRLIKAVGYACEGIGYTFITEKNFRIELFCFCMLLAGTVILKLSPGEILVIILSSGAVLSAEIFNTCIERLCNLYTREKDPAIKIIKDLAAGAVLVTALTAAACAAFIFIPHLLQFFKP